MRRDIRGSLGAKLAAILLLAASLIGAVYAVAGTALKSGGFTTASSFFRDQLCAEPAEGAMHAAYQALTDDYHVRQLDSVHRGFVYAIYDGDPAEGRLLTQSGEIPGSPAWQGRFDFTYGNRLDYLDEGIQAMITSDHCTVIGYLPYDLPAGSTFAALRTVYDLYRWISPAALSVLSAVCCLLALGSLLFLLSAAGHRRDREGIVPNWQDRIPLDLYLAVMSCGLFLIGFAVAACLDNLTEMPYLMVPLACLSVLGCFILALAVLMSLATRLKLRRWWRNTLCWRLLRWCWLVWKRLWRAAADLVGILPLTWRSILLAAGVLFVQFLLAVLFYETYNGGFFFLVMLIFDAAVVIAAAWLTRQLQLLKEGGQSLADGNLDAKIDTKKMRWDLKDHAENLNAIGEGMTRAVEQRLKSERLKTELITNVSHDIKTPLTSIINYVDLLQKQELPETAEEYLAVLARQSARLKKLTEDLVEASKASTGNVSVKLEPIVVNEIVHQAVGDYEERLTAGNLEVVVGSYEGNLSAYADGRLLWRVLDNLLSNVCKYAMAGTRVYVDVTERENRVYLTMKNISRDPLNISADELMERFVRGDAARHTEGSGLGLNIAKSLMDLMGGSFTLAVDGDLFKAELSLSQTYPGGASAAPELELPETEDGKPSPIREAAQLLRQSIPTLELPWTKKKE